MDAVSSSQKPRWGSNLKDDSRSNQDIYPNPLVGHFTCPFFLLQSLFEYVSTCLTLAANFSTLLPWLMGRFLIASSSVSPVAGLRNRLFRYRRRYSDTQ